MEGWSRLCADKDVERLILDRIERSGLSAHVMQAVQREVEKPGVRSGEVESTAYRCVATSGLEVQLKNAVYWELMRLAVGGVAMPVAPPPEQRKEPLGFLREAQGEWESKLRRGVNTLCTQQGVPLARERTPQERDSFRKKWNSIANDYPSAELQNLHPIFSLKDFLEVLIRVRNPNFTSEEFCETGGGLIQVQLNTKSLSELREQFSSLHPSNLQVEGALLTNYEAEYTEKAAKVLRVGLSPLGRQLCMTGSPITHRRRLWSLAMGVDTTHPQHAFHFEQLKSSVFRHVLLFERLLVKDVKKTAANDDDYFVFEDTMHQVLLAFLHDSTLLQHFHSLSVTPFKAFIKGNVGVPEYEAVYPPNGVVPFHGFSMYVAPLCFLFDRPDHLYALFKAMYIRYFVHLHNISSHTQGILSLCCQFESLLQARQPELCQHLRSVGAQPLRLAFGWLMSAFSGFLDSRELLLLWDRVLGFGSLEVVPVVAVAVFEFRATNLFKVTSLAEAEVVLSDIQCLKVLPLLQQTLFL